MFMPQSKGIAKSLPDGTPKLDELLLGPAADSKNQRGLNCMSLVIFSWYVSADG